MCVRDEIYAPPECITFRTIRRALAELRRDGDRLVRPVSAGTSAPLVRLAYVVGKLRAADDVDCDRAADYLLELFTGQGADRRDDEA